MALVDEVPPIEDTREVAHHMQPRLEHDLAVLVRPERVGVIR